MYMKKWYSIAGLALVMIVFFACQKEKSFEVGNNPSDGTLQSEATGDCLPKVVNGLYVAETPLVTATNTIAISVNVTQTGTYTISSDTVNGYFFLAKGLFVKLGANAVTLRSNGTPFTSGVNNFVITYNNSSCDVAVTVLPKGSTPAVYTLEATAGNCGGAVVNGSYATGLDLNFTNTVTLSVNVTTIGTYTITTAKNGMTFSGSGAFTTTGVQTITLNGTGIPTVSGDNIVPVTAGTSTCNFTVKVGAPAVGTFGGAGGACTGTVVNGTYTVGTPLVGTTNTIDIPVNVTTPGVFSISTNIVGGISFSASGTFSTTGNVVVTLNGVGTPTAPAGTKTFTVTFGTSTCTFDVPVSGGAAGTAVFTPSCAGAAVSGTYKVGTALTATNTLIIPVSVTTAGTYNITTTTVNGMTFTGTGSLTLASASITLTGSGTPLTATTSNIPIPGTTSCNVAVTVTAATGGTAIFSANCASATVSGTYQAGTPLTAVNTITLPVTVATAGSYSVSTTATNGMIFTGSGTLALGAGTIVLTGTGSTPTAAASPSNIPMPGTSPCTVAVTVTGAATIDWSFKIGTTTYQGQSSLPDITYDNTSSPPFAVLDYLGDNVAGDELSFTLLDLTGGITASEQYASTSTFTTNAAAFYFIDAANTIDLTAQPADPGPPPTGVIGNIVFTVTSHVAATKTIIGTFSGTAFDAISNTTKTITNGTFRAVYH